MPTLAICILVILAILILLAGTILYYHGLSFENRGLWSQLKDGHFAEVLSGNAHNRFISRHRELWQEKDSTIRPRKGKEKKRKFQRFHPLDIPRLGMYFTGIRPFNALKFNIFTTKTVKRVSEIKDGTITLGETQDCPVGGFNTPLVFIYAIQSPTIELKDKTRVGAITQTTLRFKNLYKAMYDTEQSGGFMSNVHTVEHASQREIVSEVPDYDELVRQKSEGKVKDGYADKFQTRASSGLEMYGVTCIDVDFVDHHPADIKTANATAALRIAQLNALAEIAEKKGKGDAEAAEANGKARAKTTIGRADAAVKAMDIRFSGTERTRALDSILKVAGEHTDVAIAMINGEAAEVAFGEGPQGTRPDVISLGQGGMNILADGRKTKKNEEPKADAA